MSVCEGFCSEKEKPGNLLISRMETSRVRVSTAQSRAMWQEEASGTHRGRHTSGLGARRGLPASASQSDWISPARCHLPAMPGHSGPLLACCQPLLVGAGTWPGEDRCPWGGKKGLSWGGRW